MPCYHPMIRYEDRTRDKIKAKDGHRYYKAIIEGTDPVALPFELERISKNPMYHNPMVIPCGKCIGCRLDYSREWANRGYLESLNWKQNWFVTLTYDEEHLIIPEEIESEEGITYTKTDEWKGTLVPEHLTQFIKNLRQIMKRDHNEEGIRFIACGEYGDQGERPHYHAILFNLNLPIEDLYEPRIINKEVYYRSHIIERAWNKGISNISECTWNTIAYTTRYITKKINGKDSGEIYAEKGQEKEFLRVSRMPGIGQKYFEDNWQKIYKNDEIIIKNKEGVISSKPPKYYDDLLEQKDPKLYQHIKAKRRREQKWSELVTDQKSSLSRLEQKLIDERTNEEKHLKLIREFEKGRQ